MTTRMERMRHERRRWDYMTSTQMGTRLRKIEVPAKLAVFIEFAQLVSEGEYPHIRISAQDARRLREIALRQVDDMGFNVVRRPGSARVQLIRRGPAGQQIRDHVREFDIDDRPEDVRALRPGVEPQTIPESRLPTAQEILEDARGRIEGEARARPPSEEQLEQYKEEERIRQGVRKIRFNGKNKKEEDEPHQPRLPGMDEDPPW